MFDGILNVYKEPGFTSHDVVAKLRGILRQKKIGHTGTLDPDAVGVLPVCLGKGTKLCDMLTDRDKVYEAELYLGVETDTLDMSGQVLRSCFVGLKQLPDDSENKQPEMMLETAQIVDAVKSFEGRYAQIPPMYSALKVNGQKLCDLARAGVEVERKARMVEIYSIDILDIKPLKDGKISVIMTVHCSKGTYIRSLCDDIGKKLGCGGAMNHLVRTTAAGFSIDQALKLQDIETLVQNNELENYIMPVESAFAGLPKVYMKEECSRFLYNGNPFDLNSIQKVTGELCDGCRVSVYDHQCCFLAVYSYCAANETFRTVKMFL